MEYHVLAGRSKRDFSWFLRALKVLPIDIRGASTLRTQSAEFFNRDFKVIDVNGAWKKVPLDTFSVRVKIAHMSIRLHGGIGFSEHDLMDELSGALDANMTSPIGEALRLAETFDIARLNLERGGDYDRAAETARTASRYFREAFAWWDQHRHTAAQFPGTGAYIGFEAICDLI